MGICKNCKSLDICTEANKDKKACWFFSPTEKYRIEQSKEYAIGYEQGRTDRTKEFQQQFDMLYSDKLEQVRADERAKVLNEILEMDRHECAEEMCNMIDNELSCASCYAYKLLEQLKEQ